MELNRQELNDWENIFNSLAKEGGDLSAELIKEGIQELIAKYNRLDVEDVIDLSVSAHNDVLSEFGTTASLSSEDMFVSLAEKSNIDAISSYYDVKDIINQDIVRQAFKTAFFENLKGALKDANVDGYLSATKDIFSNSIHICQRETMLRNADKNGQRVARVTSGAKPCSYCYMLSSRGFVYKSEETAIASGHVHCNCTLITGKPGDKIAGYNYEARKEVRSIFEKVCGVDLSKGYDHLSETEKEKVDFYNSLLSEQFLQNAEPGKYGETERYKEWVKNLKGKELKDYLRRHAREENSVELLQVIGIDTIFDIDVSLGEDGLRKGLVDLKNGIELKATEGIASKRAIKNAFINYEKKVGEKKLLFFDFRSVANYDFNEEEKSKIKKRILNQIKIRKSGHVLAYFPDGEYVLF